MKKIAWLLVAVLLLGLLSGCAKKTETETELPETVAGEPAVDANVDPVTLFLPLMQDVSLLAPMLQELYPDLQPGTWDFAVTSGDDNPEITARYQEQTGDWYVVQLRISHGAVYALNTKQLKAAYPISEIYRQSDRFYYLCSVPTEKGTGFYEDNLPKEGSGADMAIRPVLFRSQAEILAKLQPGASFDSMLDLGDPVAYSELVH